MKEIVFLILMLIPSTSTRYPQFYYHEMISMQECQQVIASSKIEVARGADAESSIVMYCAYGKAVDDSFFKKYF